LMTGPVPPPPAAPEATVTGSNSARSDGCISLLRWCYSGVPLVLQWCYSGVTVK
jgi:hypothetical protein